MSIAVLITGANPAGLGYYTARAIATQGPNLIVLTYRSPEKRDKVVEALSKEFPDVKLETVQIELSSLPSVRAGAEAINNNPAIPHIDVQINNAGVMSIQNREVNAEGVEMHMASNHLGHFLLTNLILGKLLKAAETAPPGRTRIVNISGGWHQFSPIRFHDLNFEGKTIPPEEEPNTKYLAVFGHATSGNYIPEVAYAQSKTANICHATSLTEKLKDRGILAFGINPGGKIQNPSVTQSGFSPSL
jgi:NAD(P)-dependent dehydrogenase (short-subunit alcohol dehydrogenase family)